MSQGGGFYENSHFISHVEFGVGYGVFKGADYENDIVGGLCHRFRALFRGYGQK